jgi:putative chitinase
MDIGMFTQLFPQAPQDYLTQMAAQADGLFGSFGFSDAGMDNRLPYFLANVGHESGGCTITHENLNYSTAARLCAVWPSRFPTEASAQPYVNNPEALANNVYAGRMGNTQPGDGYIYRGRGYIQLTGRDAYTAVGKAAGLDLVNSPDLAAAPENALRVACGFWAWKGLNPICDTGDFNAVVKKINGGLNGLDDRNAWLAKVRKVLAGESVRDPNAKSTIQAVQQALNNRGYTEVGTADGIWGNNSQKGADRFRKDNNLNGVGNKVDATLLSALEL